MTLSFLENSIDNIVNEHLQSFYTFNGLLICLKFVYFKNIILD